MSESRCPKHDLGIEGLPCICDKGNATNQGETTHNFLQQIGGLRAQLNISDTNHEQVCVKLAEAEDRADASDADCIDVCSQLQASQAREAVLEGRLARVKEALKRNTVWLGEAVEAELSQALSDESKPLAVQSGQIPNYLPIPQALENFLSDEPGCPDMPLRGGHRQVTLIAVERGGE